jgi:hypothetical protein
LPVVWAGAVLVPWPVASELPVPTAEVPVGVALEVPDAPLPEVPVVPDSDVPVWLEPELLPLDDELPLLLSVALVPVELHAARLIAIRPPIRRAWYFFMFTPVVKVTTSWGHTYASEIGCVRTDM